MRAFPPSDSIRMNEWIHKNCDRFFTKSTSCSQNNLNKINSIIKFIRLNCTNQSTTYPFNRHLKRITIITLQFGLCHYSAIHKSIHIHWNYVTKWILTLRQVQYVNTLTGAWLHGMCEESQILSKEWGWGEGKRRKINQCTLRVLALGLQPCCKV